jgi:hypothetical protein
MNRCQQLRAFAVLSPNIVAFCKDFSGARTALSASSTGHGSNPRTRLSALLWLRRCRAMHWRWPALKLSLLGVLLSTIPLLEAEEEAVDASRTEIHFAFSKSMFTGVNENDAQAAMKVYGQTIGDQNGLYVTSGPILLDGTNAIAEAVASGRAELFAMTFMEFQNLEYLGLEGPLLMSTIRQKTTEEYVLLARADGTLRLPEDLKGRSLMIGDDIRSCLAPLWLEVLCREHGLESAALSLGKISYSSKPSQVVLPVFFGKADACVVTRNSWEVMCELNPQLQKQMRTVAISPPLVPALTCFTAGISEKHKQRVFRAVELSSTKPSYQQVMALFKCDGVVRQPLSVLDDTRKLVATYQKLAGALPAAGSLRQTAATTKPEADR